MKEKTKKLCEVLGIEHPVILGGMAYLGRHALAAAVSEAGGLGQLACAGTRSVEELREEIRLTKTLTGKPFAVNIPASVKPERFQEQVRAAFEEGVRILTIGGGNPLKLIPPLKAQGFTVISVAGCAKHARKAQEAGADLIVAEGVEAGGHNNLDEITTMVLVPQIVDAVSLPVIAAGGIADGRGMAAALCLGACGVQIGTRFIASAECAAHDNLKQAIISATEQDTFILGREDHLVMRALRTPVSEKYLALERNGSFHFKDMIQELGRDVYYRASMQGDLENALFYPGQDVGAIREVLPAAEIIESLLRDCRELLPQSGV